MEYTKGEWAVKRDDMASMREIYVTDETGQYVCTMLGMQRHITELEANAHLIASAPDLYEACKEQHQAIDILFARLIELDRTFFPSKSGKPWEAAVQGFKAIAKAETPA